MFSSVQSKILATTISVIVGFVGLALLILWIVVQRFAAEEIERDLISGRQTYERYVAQRREMLVRKTLSLSKVPYLVATLSADALDARSAAVAIDEVREAAGRSLIVLLDADGNYVAGTTGKHRFGDDFTKLPGISRALAGEVADTVWTDDTLRFVAVAPVIAGRELVGVIALEEVIDAAFAEEMRIVTGRDVLVLAQQRKITESWQRSGATTKVAEVNNLVARLVSKDDRASESFGVDLGGEARFALAIPLPDSSGHVILSRAVEELLVVATRSWMLLLLAGVFVAVLGSWASLGVARRLSNPLGRLIEASDALASGQLDTAVSVETCDEVGKLSASFNLMARRIERLVHDVQASALQAGEANRAKNMFLASVSHELRTPLTSIYAYTELLMTYGSGQSEEESEFLGVIRSETEQLMRLVDDVLELTALDSAEHGWNLQCLDVEELLRKVTNVHRAELAARGVDLALRMPSARVHLEGDRDRLQNVLARVFQNACNFSPDGQPIAVEVEVDAEIIEIRIVDRGPGIPDESKAEVFERFVQLGDGLTDKPPGTGLGLAISREILTAHGGRIHCENTVGGGATFVIRLPSSSAGAIDAHRARQSGVTLAIPSPPRSRAASARETAPTRVL